jgi:hypothetical protein
MINGCLPTVLHIFSMYSIEKLGNTRKHVVVSGKQKIIGVESVEDCDEDVN